MDREQLLDTTFLGVADVAEIGPKVLNARTRGRPSGAEGGPTAYDPHAPTPMPERT